MANQEPKEARKPRILLDSPLIINATDAREDLSATRECDGPCGNLRFAANLQIFGRCEHAICPLCITNAPMVLGPNGDLNCPNVECFLLDLANCVEDAEDRRRFLKQILDGGWDVSELLATYKPSSQRRTIEKMEMIRIALANDVQFDYDSDSSLTSSVSTWTSRIPATETRAFTHIQLEMNSSKEDSSALTDSVCFSNVPMSSDSSIFPTRSLDSSYTATAATGEIDALCYTQIPRTVYSELSASNLSAHVTSCPSTEASVEMPVGGNAFWNGDSDSEGTFVTTRRFSSASSGSICSEYESASSLGPPSFFHSDGEWSQMLNL
ncbi:hypothetical protein L596_016046 [Steinernema carpocapsae]|uniref:Uncharacterized protein n=1 Tax=Steinernema carpocapsae TaxID=34508 RepID=A0A4U5NHF6_STECR|nr:hypothetical protein L596_016046 [Steinernema carpocapsae]